MIRERLLNELRETEEASRRQAEVLVKVFISIYQFCFILLSKYFAVSLKLKVVPNGKSCLTLQGLDAERDVLRESQRLASERDRELESLRQQVSQLL